jgi:hypothetical protein
MTGVLILGKEFLGLFWASKNFSLNLVNFSYLVFIGNFSGMLIYSFASIYRKSVVSYGKAQQLYLFMSVGQLICAILVKVLAIVLNENIVIFIVLINSIVSTIMILIPFRFTGLALSKSFNVKNVFVSFAAVGVVYAIFYYILSRNALITGSSGFISILYFVIKCISVCVVTFGISYFFNIVYVRSISTSLYRMVSNKLLLK